MILKDKELHVFTIKICDQNIKNEINTYVNQKCKLFFGKLLNKL
jgi:hypothetical protein